MFISDIKTNDSEYDNSLFKELTQFNLSREKVLLPICLRFSMNFGSLYARLRLTASATQAEIKSAYYRLSKLYHPDKNNDCPKATVQFRNITEAYEVLSDSKSKAAYDKGYCVNKLLVNFTNKSNLFHTNHRTFPSESFKRSFNSI